MRNPVDIQIDGDLRRGLIHLSRRQCSDMAVEKRTVCPSAVPESNRPLLAADPVRQPVIELPPGLSRHIGRDHGIRQDEGIPGCLCLFEIEIDQRPVNRIAVIAENQPGADVTLRIADMMPHSVYIVVESMVQHKTCLRVARTGKDPVRQIPARPGGHLSGKTELAGEHGAEDLIRTAARERLLDDEVIAIVVRIALKTLQDLFLLGNT